MPTFVDRGCHVVSVTDPYGHNLCFLDWRRYFFFQVAPQLYSRGWVDPVSDPLLLRKSGSAGNRIQTSGSVTARPQRRSIYFVLHYIMLLCTDVNYISLIQEMSPLDSIMAWLFGHSSWLNNSRYARCVWTKWLESRHLYIPQEPSSGLKYAVSRIIKTSVCVTITPLFLFRK
jgi:hypothetical protein